MEGWRETVLVTVIWYTIGKSIFPLSIRLFSLTLLAHAINEEALWCNQIPPMCPSLSKHTPLSNATNWGELSVVSKPIVIEFTYMLCCYFYWKVVTNFIRRIKTSPFHLSLTYISQVSYLYIATHTITICFTTNDFLYKS